MNTPKTNETLQNLFLELGIDADHTSKSLNTLATANNRYIRDLKLNVTTVLSSANLSRKEAYLLALSVAVNEQNNTLIDAFEALAVREGATADELAETHGCASLMSVNNVFYRFKHYMHTTEFYNHQPAGLRMSLMMNVTMGKPLFELMSLVISAVNGCERCCIAHEHSVKELGTGEPRIFDAIRLGAVIKGLCTVI
jgi:alkyl hydroperoxide reductase subunit D